ncbi:MAG: DNA polymerase III subunit gamma/tau [Clostridia bacterium]|nr:DNA polymerase III subunit gamma/tau [Clostridia bacterium]
MYQALYRSERPEIFSEILGQEHIVKILKNQIKTGTVSHAYLFCGTRGTGKTTTARILAKAVNCTCEGERPCGECENCKAIKEGRFMDVIEIDAASNNGVDSIRELKESVNIPPQIGKCKVYIIDEVHMLSTGAFNALLKTLEEPPENVMFILATTEPQKLPQTVLSRCLRLDFKRVPEEKLIEGMLRICQERGVTITEDGLKLLASNADGSVRDGLSILDQCLSTGEKQINREMILQFLGTVGEEFFIDLTEKVIYGKVSDALMLINNVLAEGKDVKQLMKDWNAHFRNLLITKYVEKPENMLNMSLDNIKRLERQSSQIELAQIDRAIIILSRTINEARWSTQARILLEMAMVEIATDSLDPSKIIPIKKNREVEETEFVEEIKAQVKAEPKVEVKAETKAEPKADNDEEDFDLDEIWAKVFDMCGDGRPSFNLLRTGTSLKEINESTFQVTADNFIMIKYLEENGKQIENIMCKLLGRLVRMEILEDSKEESGLADKIEDMLGLKVDIK